MGFVYIWHDKLRNMFYVGSHEGTPDDGYVSTSKWFNYEHTYRPQDFRRKIIKFVDVARLKDEEYNLLNKIKSEEFGRKYYNLRPGRQKGSTPWNKGLIGVYSEEHLANLSNHRKSRMPWNKGKSTGTRPSTAVEKQAKSLSQTAKGRFRVYRDDGSWTWGYP